MYVHVYTGLMSRCFTLAQCYYLAKKYQYKVVVVWQMEGGCNISYHDCFAPEQFNDIELEVIEIKTPMVIEKGIVAYLKEFRVFKACQMLVFEVRNILRKRELHQKLLFRRLKSRYPYICFDPTSSEEEIGWYGEKYLSWLMKNWQNMKGYLEQGQDFFLSAYCGVIRDDEKDLVDYQTIQFMEECCRISDGIMKEHTNWVGIHIRRTDHHICIENSPTEAFVIKMKEILEKDSFTKFYLATDDREVERELQSIFRGSVVVYSEKAWGRENTQAIWSGIVDFLCLSKCSHIYGSYSSSYSNFAAIYGKKEITICE